jgi:beta propeller repeat protein
MLVLAAAAAALSATGCAAQAIDPEVDAQLSPAYNGGDVAWEDSRNEETDGTDVYMYRADLGTVSKLAGGQGDQDQPAISSQYVAWIDQGRLMAKALPSGQPFAVANGSPTSTDPALCGSLVVWTDTNNNSDVYAKQLPDGPVIPVAASPAVEAYPDCDAGRVVYMYAPVGVQSDIRLYDVGSGQTTTVSDQPWNEWRPAISGNRVVWQALTSDIQIYGKNLDTGENFVVSEGPDSQTAPVISGSTVAWQDNRSGTPQIWWRDLATTMPQIPVDSTLKGRQEEPSLVNRQVVFQSDATGAWNVYEATLFFFTGSL